MQKLRAVLAPLAINKYNQQDFQVNQNSKFTSKKGSTVLRKSFSENQASLSSNQLQEKSLKFAKTLSNLTESLKKDCAYKIQGKKEYKLSIQAALQLIQESSFEISQKLQSLTVPSHEQGIYYADNINYFNVAYQALQKACNELQTEKGAISHHKMLHLRQCQSLQITTQAILKLLTSFLEVDNTDDAEIQKLKEDFGLTFFNNEVSIYAYGNQNSNIQPTYNNSGINFSNSNLHNSSQRKTQSKISQKQLKKQSNEAGGILTHKSDINHKVKQWLESQPDDLIQTAQDQKVGYSSSNSKVTGSQTRLSQGKKKLNLLIESLSDDDVVEGLKLLCAKTQKGEANFESIQEMGLFNSLDIQFVNGSDQVKRWIFQLITILVSSNFTISERIIMEYNWRQTRKQLDLQDNFSESVDDLDYKVQALNSNMVKLPKFLRLNYIKQNIIKVTSSSAVELKQHSLLTLGLLGISNVDIQSHLIENKAISHIIEFFLDDAIPVRIAALIATGQLQGANIRALQELQNKGIPDLIHSFVDDLDEDINIRKWSIWCIGCFALTQVQCRQKVLEFHTKKLLEKFKLPKKRTQEDVELMDMAVKCILDISYEKQLNQNSFVTKSATQIK